MSSPVPSAVHRLRAHRVCGGPQMLPVSRGETCPKRATVQLASHCPRGHQRSFDLCDGHAWITPALHITCRDCFTAGAAGVPLVFDTVTEVTTLGLAA